MSQRYERVPANDSEESSQHPPTSQTSPYHSPPPSFRSRTSSFATPRESVSENDPLQSEAQRTLADTFDDGAESDDDNHGMSRRRLMRAVPAPETAEHDAHSTHSTERRPATIERRVTELPVSTPQTGAGTPMRVYGGGSLVNDGVFANLSAKPGRGEEVEEKPPTYEQAAADATPPYWETTILAPSGMSSDAVFVDGLPVGSLFSFIWNGMISMSFQLVGFLLTYLLHTSHAAKNGSKAGLGITLVQYGFSMKARSSSPAPGTGGPDNGGYNGAPPDPNAHDFNPNDAAAGNGNGSVGGFTTNDYLSYILMIVGWFILIKSISEYIRARKHEQLVLRSPDRGLGVAVVAEGERPESAV